jgi:hypothetical protein
MPLRLFGSRSRRAPEEPTEYLYVDRRRLDSYVEQIAGGGTYDRIPTYTASLGLTGPSVEVSSGAQPRDFLVHEKIDRLVDHLRRGGFVAEGRRGTDLGEPEAGFRLETCTAARALLPPAPGSLAIWISEPPDDQPSDEYREVGRLYLIEDFRGCDFEGAGHVSVSGYTALEMLLEDEGVRPSLAATPLRRDMAAEFGARPLELVARLDGRVAAPRRIRTLYRVRASFAEMHADFARVTIGYPIFVAAA